MDQSLLREIDNQGLSPLWDVLSSLVHETPQPLAKPALWRYNDIAPLLKRAGELITAEQAERRVLILENPSLRGQSKIADSLFAGLQLILPGESAPPHRHSQSALRFVLEGEGAFTSVDGERAAMHRGDFIITAGWRWHDHGNEANESVVWLDGLDIPIVDTFKATFMERCSAEQMQIEMRPEGFSKWKYGSGFAPIEHPWGEASSPTFIYPYKDARAALSGIASFEQPDPHHAFRLKYVNAVSNDWAMPTIAPYMSFLPTGFETVPHRSTENRVWVCVEGSGTAKVGSQEFKWAENDIFVAPSWNATHLHSDSNSFLFSFSDRSAQEKLGLFREVCGAHSSA